MRERLPSLFWVALVPQHHSWTSADIPPRSLVAQQAACSVKGCQLQMAEDNKHDQTRGRLFTAESEIGGILPFHLPSPFFSPNILKEKLIFSLLTAHTASLPAVTMGLMPLINHQFIRAALSSPQTLTSALFSPSICWEPGSGHPPQNC